MVRTTISATAADGLEFDASAGHAGVGVAHDPEKWVPVFGQDHAPRKKRSVLLFLERVAERVCRIDAEDGQLLGEEAQLLQREHQRAVVRVALRHRQ